MTEHLDPDTTDRLGQFKVHTHIGFERAHTQEQAEAKLISLKAQLPHAAREQPEAFWIEPPHYRPIDAKDIISPSEAEELAKIYIAANGLKEGDVVRVEMNGTVSSAGTHHPNPVEQAQCAALLGVAAALMEGVEDPKVKAVYKPGLRLANLILTNTATAIANNTVNEDPDPLGANDGL